MKIEMIKGLLCVVAIVLVFVMNYLENKYPSNWYDEIKYSIHPQLRPKPAHTEEKSPNPNTKALVMSIRENLPIIICPKCKGSGEKIQDVNKMMMEAKCAIWMNGHTAGNAGCKDCKIVDNKYEHCEKAKIALTKFVEEYEKAGPEMSNAACPGCMGSGSFNVRNDDGTWMNQEQYEAWQVELELKKRSKENGK
jgi:hypothetical protein